MSSSSLANWDGSQSTRNPRQSYKGDVRTLGLSVASGTANDRTGACLDASSANWEGHRAVTRPGEGYNQRIPPMVHAQAKMSSISHLSSSVNIPKENATICEDYNGSTYSTDAEGEPDDEHAPTPSGVLKLFSSLPIIHQPQDRRQVDADATPSMTVFETPNVQHQQDLMPHPPVSPDAPVSPSYSHDLGSLFTPPPSDQSALAPSLPPLPKRVYLSYVAVPPIPAGRLHSDYVRISQNNRLRPGGVHHSLGEALQSSLDHNTRLGALLTTSALHTKKRDRREGDHVEKKMRQRTRHDAIAGPSSVSISRHSREDVKRVDGKQDRDESCDDDPAKKRWMTYQDLERKPRTFSEELPGRRRTRTCSYPHTEYNAEEDSLQLFIGTIPPVPAAILSLNTRFARAAAHGKEMDKEKENISKSHKKVMCNKHGQNNSWFAWPPAQPSFLDALGDEYLAGGLVKQEGSFSDEDEEEEEEEEVEIPTQPRTKRQREISPESAAEYSTRARKKEKGKEKEVAKRHVHAVEPLLKLAPPAIPRLRLREAELEHYDIHRKKSISPLPSPHPSNMKINPEHPLEPSEDSRGGTVPRNFNAEVVRGISPAGRSPEQSVSPSDRHRLRKPLSVATQGGFRKRDNGQEGMNSSPGRHQFRKPSSRVTQESPFEWHAAHGDGMIVLRDRHRSHKPSSRVVQELSLERHEAEQEMLSSSSLSDLPCIIAQETLEQHRVSKEAVFSPPPGPSAKALGKQRAVTPLDPCLGSNSPSPVPQFTVNHDISASQQHPYVPAVSNGSTLPTDFFVPSTRLGVAPFMPQLPLDDPDNFLSVSPPSNAYDLDLQPILPDSPFLPPSITTHLGDFISPELIEATINPWQVSSNASSSLSGPPPSAIYGDGTINPSLLGGVQDMTLIHFTPPSSPALPSPSHSVAHSPSPWAIISGRSRSTPSGSPFPSSSSSSSSFSSKSPTPPVAPLGSQSRSAQRKPSISVSEYYAEREAPTSVSLRAPRPSRHASRQMPAGMILTDDLNLYATSDFESDEPIADRINRAKTSSKVMKLGPPQRKQRVVDGSNSPLPEPQNRKCAERSKWPVCNTPTFCHQCRSRTNIAKLRCPCGKMYCVRCLSTRYEGEFIHDPSRLTFTCPCCQKTCTCDHCTRKRGGVYIPLRLRVERSPQSLRSGSPPILNRSERVKHKPKKVPEILNSAPPPARPRSSLGGKTNLPPFSMAKMTTTTTTTGPEAYWATMYSITGERIGRAFVGEDGKHNVVRVRPLQGGKRIFVGAVQPSWGLGPNAVLKDVDPPKKKTTGKSHLRYYIGNKAVLYHPTAPKFTDQMETGDGWELYDGFSSPLSSLEDGPLSGGEGESRQWPSLNESDLGTALQEGIDAFLAKGPGNDFSPDSLRETDVARAITLGLMACGHGIQVQVGDPNLKFEH